MYDLVASRQAYDSHIWEQCKYFGIQTYKWPTDLHVLQEILFDVKPDFVIEAGTWKGGSALFIAHVLDQLHNGEVITIDIDRKPNLPVHPRIVYLNGNSLTVDLNMVDADGKVLVILDSNHTSAHVTKELGRFSSMVSKGSYLIVEDGNIDGMPGWPTGPAEAITKFLSVHPEFEADRSREKYITTFNPGGFLLRK